MTQRKYYEAYDARYRQVHGQGLQWFDSAPSPIVGEIMQAFSLTSGHKLLELGCGEGRDAFPLLKQGYQLLATDISAQAIAFCREKMPEQAQQFQVLDCVGGSLKESFDFIYAVAVVHMLVENEDRKAFYRFIRGHLRETGIALICTMGDGTVERKSDIQRAFDLQERVHRQTGRTLLMAGTSCRMVSFPTFRQELEENGLEILQQGITAVEPDFPQMMFAVVKRK